MVGNQIIEVLAAESSLLLELIFKSPAGLYELDAVIFFNNLPIADSKNSVPIQVLSPKIGDNETPIVAILALALFFILLLLGQATYDAIKLKNINLGTNGN